MCLISYIIETRVTFHVSHIMEITTLAIQLVKVERFQKAVVVEAEFELQCEAQLEVKVGFQLEVEATCVSCHISLRHVSHVTCEALWRQ